ncbi:hypothetical protein C3473_24690 [Mycobacterium kansasii]|nr:hypothetical protein C3473_24690 [Mycobacterium kansasii]
MRTISDKAGLAQLPNLSVVQFRGESLGSNNRLIWQLDEEWYAPGSEDPVKTEWFPPEAYPAVVLWEPDLT